MNIAYSANDAFGVIYYHMCAHSQTKTYCFVVGCRMPFSSFGICTNVGSMVMPMDVDFIRLCSQQMKNEWGKKQKKT